MLANKAKRGIGKEDMGKKKERWKKEEEEECVVLSTLEPTTFNQNHQKNKKTANSHVHTLARISFL